LNGALESVGLAASNLRCFPEPVLKENAPEGPRLITSIDGCEAQIVGPDGRLIASRWWPTPPDVQEWRNFQRGAGVPAEAQSDAVPSPADLPLGPPWTDYIEVERLAVRLPLAEHAAYAALCVALGIPLVWYGVEALRAQRALADVNAALESVEQASAPALAAREAALAASNRLRPLAAAFGGPSALSALAAVSRGIPDDGTQVREFEYRDQAVRIVLAPSSSLTGGALVQSFETAGVFRDVSVTAASGGLLTLVAKIDARALQTSTESESAQVRAARVTPGIAAGGMPGSVPSASPPFTPPSAGSPLPQATGAPSGVNPARSDAQGAGPGPAALGLQPTFPATLPPNHPGSPPPPGGPR